MRAIKFNRDREAGFSLVEVMIAMGVMSALSLAMAGLLANQAKQTHNQQIKSNRNDLKSTVDVLSGNSGSIIRSAYAGSSGQPLQTEGNAMLFNCLYDSATPTHDPNPGTNCQEVPETAPYGFYLIPPYVTDANLGKAAAVGGPNDGAIAANNVYFDGKGARCSPAASSISDCGIQVIVTFTPDCDGNPATTNQTCTRAKNVHVRYRVARAAESVVPVNRVPAMAELTGEKTLAIDELGIDSSSYVKKLGDSMSGHLAISAADLGVIPLPTAVNPGNTAPTVALGLDVKGSGSSPASARVSGDLYVGGYGAVFKADEGGSLELGPERGASPAGALMAPYIDFHTKRDVFENYSTRLKATNDSELSFISKNSGSMATLRGQLVGPRTKTSLLLNDQWESTIHFAAQEVAPPGAGSKGMRINFWATGGFGNNSAGDYGLGMDSGYLWANSGGGFRWYRNSGLLVMEMRNDSRLWTGGDFEAAGNATIRGNLTVDRDLIVNQNAYMVGWTNTERANIRSHGGNVPFACRVTSNIGGTSYLEVDCDVDAGEIAVGGGASCGNDEELEKSFPKVVGGVPRGWIRECSNSPGAMRVYAICCRYQ